MDEENIEKYGFYKKLTLLPFVEEIWLFGSRARNDNQDRADIDLAVLCPSASSNEWQTIVDIVDDADTLLQIDCVRLDELDQCSELKKSILTQGKKLYGNYKVELGFKKLEKALISLEVIAVKPPNEDRSNIDATIQRFEFTFELFWKLLKAILETKGVNLQYPKDILKEAFKGHLINNQNQWLEMLKDRNLSCHTYDEKLADQVYANIKKNTPFLRSSFDNLKQS